MQANEGPSYPIQYRTFSCRLIEMNVEKVVLRVALLMKSLLVARHRHKVTDSHLFLIQRMSKRSS